MSEQQPRKATDVLLELETKINTLLDLCRNQDLNIKILSNKLNDLSAKLDKQPPPTIKYTAETIQKPQPQQTPTTNVMPTFLPHGYSPQTPDGDPERNIPIQGSSSMAMTIPQGARRTSRETVENPKPQEDLLWNPHQTKQKKVAPPVNNTDIVAPMEAFQQTQPSIPTPSNTPLQQTESMPEKTISIMQRCCDVNGKASFLANVEIMDKKTFDVVFKGRTSAVGKWMASLPMGDYKVSVKKQGSASMPTLEAVQEIVINGQQSKIELPALVLK